MNSIIKTFVVLFGFVSFSLGSFAQILERPDPDLVEVVDRIKAFSSNPLIESLRPASTPAQSFDRNRDMEKALEPLFLYFIKKDETAILQGLELLKNSARTQQEIKIAGEVSDLYSAYFVHLDEHSGDDDFLEELSAFESSGSWIQRFLAHQLAAYIQLNGRQSQKALEEAIESLSAIPIENGPLTNFARVQATDFTAHIHNTKANTKMAISATNDLLDLLETDFDPVVGIDLLNNLLYSHVLLRMEPEQNYLTSALLELEKTIKPNVPGLTELRIAQSRAEASKFQDALKYAKASQAKTNIDVVNRQARTAEAIAYIGLGERGRGLVILGELGVDLSSNTLLTTETKRNILYAGYLLALESGDNGLATKLYNRRIDVLSNKLLGASARDTASMLASLENSRERQAERAAANAREAALQAETIRKQRQVNRLLMALLAGLSAALVSLLIFLRYREKIMKQLAIKSREAKSAERLKTEFLGLVSHELRTPLNGVIGLSDILARTHDDQDTRFKAGVILDSGNRLLSVVDAMTDMARIDAQKMEIQPDLVDIPKTLAPIIAQAQARATEKELVFTAHVDSALETHEVDGLRVGQCVGYLLSNAVKFTDKGRVHLHVTPLQEEAEGPVSGMRVIVADTGIGMTELIQSRLFTPFMQADASMSRQFEGAGLSLAITRALARMMGGNVTVTTKQGRGSEFVLDLQFGVVLDPKEAKSRFRSERLIKTRAADKISVKDLLDTHTEGKPKRQKTRKTKRPKRPKTQPVDARTALQPPSQAAVKADAVKDASPQAKPKDTLPEIELIATPPSDIAEILAPVETPSVETPPPAEILDLVNVVHGSPITLTRTGPGDNALEGLRVLVVDDMPSNRDIVRLMVEAEGCICLDANDGQSALDILACETVDVVLMDIFMPGVDGVTATRRLRASDGPNADVPVIALTADNAAQTNAKCMAAGVDIFLTKPVLSEDLSNALRFAVSSPMPRVLMETG